MKSIKISRCQITPKLKSNTIFTAFVIGRSVPVRLHAFTTKVPDHLDESGGKALTREGGGRGGSGHVRFKVTPILAILLAVGGALILVFLVISAFLCIRRKPSTSNSAAARRRKSQGA